MCHQLQWKMLDRDENSYGTSGIIYNRGALACLRSLKYVCTTAAVGVRSNDMARGSVRQQQLDKGCCRILVLAITLPNLNRFFILFHWKEEDEIFNKTWMKFSTLLWDGVATLPCEMQHANSKILSWAMLFWTANMHVNMHLLLITSFVNTLRCMCGLHLAKLLWTDSQPIVAVVLGRL